MGLYCTCSGRTVFSVRILYFAQAWSVCFILSPRRYQCNRGDLGEKRTTVNAIARKIHEDHGFRVARNSNCADGSQNRIHHAASRNSTAPRPQLPTLAQILCCNSHHPYTWPPSRRQLARRRPSSTPFVRNRAQSPPVLITVKVKFLKLNLPIQP
jgi:hypothetical protein